MVEFALILPLLLMLLLGTIEFGRLIFIYVTVTSASREGARYGSAVGGNASTGLPRYRDCTGMRTAAKKVGFLAGIQDSDIQIVYDTGPHDDLSLAPDEKGTCVESTAVTPPTIELGDRIVVTVTGHFQPIIPRLIPIPINDITSRTARTILKEVSVGAAAPPPPPPPAPPEYHISWRESHLEQVEPDNVSGALGGTTQITFHLDLTTIGSAPALTQTVSVPIKWEGSAAPSFDYYISGNTVTFNPGVTSQEVVITILHDVYHEVDEYVDLTLGTPTLTSVSASTEVVRGLILDNDPKPTVYFELEEIRIEEGNPEAGTSDTHLITVNVLLSEESGVPSSVLMGVDPASTATEGEDYTFAGYHGGGYRDVAFLIYSKEQTISISITKDLDHEENETIILYLHSPSTELEIGSPSVITIYIMNDDNAPRVFFTTGHQAGREEQGTMDVVVALSKKSGKDVTVEFTKDGTATYGLDRDYTLTPESQIVHIPAGQITATITIHIVEQQDIDDAINLIETVILTLVNPQNAEIASGGGRFDVHTAAITPVLVSFSAESQDPVAENIGLVRIGVQLSRDANKTITIPFTFGGTALHGSDFWLNANPEVLQVEINPGDTEGYIDIWVNDDLLDEYDEEVVVIMGTPVNAVKDWPTIHRFNIIDNDEPPYIFFSTPTSSALENSGSYTITVQLNTPSGKAVSVGYTSDGTALLNTDYSMPASSVTIPAGSLTGDIVIQLIDDDAYEPSETVILTLDPSPDNANRRDPFVHTFTITDNENCANFAMSAVTMEGNKKVKTTLSNNSPHTAVIEMITIAWNGNNELREISLFGPTIWSGVKDLSPATVDSGWSGTIADRTMIPGVPAGGKLLVLTFQTGSLSAPVTVSVKYDNTCQITKTLQP